MTTIAFLNIGMHGHVNPTLPVVAELVRRGHTVTYHTSPAFRAEIEKLARAGSSYADHREDVGRERADERSDDVAWRDAV